MQKTPQWLPGHPVLVKVLTSSFLTSSKLTWLAGVITGWAAEF
jgi:hypothetical protein